jgi:hypothetical protein
MVGGREILMVLLAWLFQLGFFAAILFAVYRINSLHKQVEDLRTEVKAMLHRVEGVPPLQ